MLNAVKRSEEYDGHFDLYGFNTSNDTISFFSEIEMMETNLGYKPFLQYISQLQNEIERKIEPIQETFEVLEKEIQELEQKDWNYYDVDIDNLFLVHEAGEFKLKLAVERCRYAPNGNPYVSFNQYINLGIALPSEITGINSLCVEFDEIKRWIPEAVDAFSSPDGSLLAVETHDSIQIFTRNNVTSCFMYPQADYTIYKNENERVVMAEWALGDWVDKWKEEIRNNDTFSIYYFKSSSRKLRG